MKNIRLFFVGFFKGVTDTAKTAAVIGGVIVVGKKISKKG